MIAGPVNRVFGSKWRSAKKIAALIPPGIKSYVEVFAGSAAVLLSKRPHPSEFLNDLDGDVANLFQVLRDPVAWRDLARAVDLTPFHEGEFAAARAAIAAGGVAEDRIERARLYLVRAWMGMAGDLPYVTTFKVDRTASKSAAKVWADLPARIVSVAARLKGVHVLQRPAADVVRMFEKTSTALLFVDPPYPLTSINTHGRGGYRTDMDPAAHDALIASLRACHAKIVVTMAPGTVYQTGLADWTRLDLPVTGLRGARKIEHIYCNFAPSGQIELPSAGAAA